MFAADSGSHYGCEGECSVNGYHVLTAPAGINRIHKKYGKYRQQTPHAPYPANGSGSIVCKTIGVFNNFVS